MRFSQLFRSVRAYSLAFGITGVCLMTAAFAAEDMMMDTDGDGLISLAELQFAYPEMTQEIFAAIDADGSGALDELELSVAMEAGILPSEG